MLAVTLAGTEQLLWLSWGQELLVLPPEDKEWHWHGMSICVALSPTYGELGLTCHPTPEQFTHPLTVLVILFALCCLSCVDNDEGEVLLCGLGLIQWTGRDRFDFSRLCNKIAGLYNKICNLCFKGFWGCFEVFICSVKMRFVSFFLLRESFSWNRRFWVEIYLWLMPLT